MTEEQWVELIAAWLRETQLGENFEIQTQLELAYAHEIINYGDAADLVVQTYRTDLAILEPTGEGQWKPRVVVEAKVGNEAGQAPITHDAITYSQKASAHRTVHPYLRYGVILGHRLHHALPGRLYRHGLQFDFMMSFADFEPTDQERQDFLVLLEAEAIASQRLEQVLYDNRRRNRDRFTIFHRRLDLQ